MKQKSIIINGVNVKVQYGRVSDYKPTSLELISKVGLNARILDVGGGDRILKLANFVNIDVKGVKGITAVVGDAQLLPFRDNVFDIILCEGVIEHIRMPWLAADEFHRVLKPSGFVYIDAAFLQPFHSSPNHYFNVTKEGLEVLFQKSTKIDSGVQRYQMPSYALYDMLIGYVQCFLPKWFRKQTQGLEIHATGTFLPRRNILTLTSALMLKLLAKFLRFFDRFISPSRAEKISAGVFFLGTK